eukprot:3903373-Rhodomonas_salina.1
MSTNTTPTKRTENMSRAEKFREALYMVTESGRTTEVMAKYAIALTNQLNEIEAKLQITNAASTQAPPLMARAAAIRQEIQQNETNILNTKRMAYCILRDTYNADALTQVDPIPLPPRNHNACCFPDDSTPEQTVVATTTNTTQAQNTVVAENTTTTNTHNRNNN